MAFKIHIYRELNFSYTPVIGSLSDEDLHLMVLAFQIESKGLEYIREIVDFRHLRSAAGLTVEGLLRMSDLERDRSADRDVRMAVLTRDRTIRMVAEMFANVNTRGNLRVNVYGNEIDKALTWLKYDEIEQDRLMRFIGRRMKEMTREFAN